MRPLSPPDSHHLDAAEGWLGLGDHLEANAQLEEIAPSLRIHPDVLKMRWQIYAHAKRWIACEDIARTLTEIEPANMFGWIHYSFALHELKRTAEALEQLLPVAAKFPKVWNIPYNLACYCSQLQRFDEAQAWFKKAMTINEQAARQTGIDDPDLKPLWESMSGTLRKAE